MSGTLDWTGIYPDGREDDGIRNVGRASLSPSRAVVAGSHVTIDYTYTADHPIDDSGYVLVVFRYVSDFATPQFGDPAGENFCTVGTDGDCEIAARWDNKGYIRPWSKALYLQIRRGYLAKGKKIKVTFGDRRGGSPGWRMQTFCEDSFEFRTLVDPIATFMFKAVEKSPALRIKPGPADRAVCIAPSQVVAGEAFDYLLKFEDAWGNPTARAKTIRHKGFDEPGVHRIPHRDAKNAPACTSNPILAVERDSIERGHRRWWADFHGQTEETIGTNTIDDYYRFARDVARLDIVAHQGNDFQVTDAFWDEINAAAERNDQPGRLVTFPGYEWSGNTPLGGDRNVYFAAAGGRIARSCRDLLPGQASHYPDAPTAESLWRALAAPGQPESFAFAHVGGRYADLASHDPEIELAVEVHSAWGTFQWLLDEALRRGYRIGICANSDGHKCRPGASWPGAAEFGSYGGLTCVLAERLDRRSVLEALRARRFYATTGNRALIELQCTNAAGRHADMGGELDACGGPVELRWAIHPTAEVERVELRDAEGIVRSFYPGSGDADDASRRFLVCWSGAEVRGRDRLCDWSGELTVEGNRIVEAEGVNFFRPDRPLERLSPRRLRWRSATTGGRCGIVLTLARPGRGAIEMSTAQGPFRVRVDAITRRGRRKRFGGVEKEIQVVRLPGVNRLERVTGIHKLRKLRKGVNPYYLRVFQTDGCQMWTSPCYITRSC